jgi:hypothetical protein
MVFFYVVTAIMTVIATIVLIGGLAKATGSPQEAAVAAIAVAIAVLPYIFARCVEKASGPRGKDSYVRAACPRCFEQVRVEAATCPFCRAALDEGWSKRKPEDYFA